MALGLGYWRMMGLVVLPQALTLVIPGIVNTFIGLFKDTTLVAIVGMFDFLAAMDNALQGHGVERADDPDDRLCLRRRCSISSSATGCRAIRRRWSAACAVGRAALKGAGPMAADDQ